MAVALIAGALGGESAAAQARKCIARKCILASAQSEELRDAHATARVVSRFLPRGRARGSSDLMSALRRTMRSVLPLALVLLSSLPDARAEDAQEEGESEGQSLLLLYKRIDPTSDFSVGMPINVTLSVFNKGLGNAYSLVVNDDNWKMDKFRIISGASNFTLDYLNAGDQYDHTFTVAPIKKTWHRIRPARMAFIDGVEGENTIRHLSNTLPEIRIGAYRNELEEQALRIGAMLTLNVVQTKQGWMTVGAIGVLYLVMQMYLVTSKILQKRRRLRALDQAKKW